MEPYLEVLKAAKMGEWIKDIILPTETEIHHRAGELNINYHREKSAEARYNKLLGMFFLFLAIN